MPNLSTIYYRDSYVHQLKFFSLKWKKQKVPANF
jgi:hypothetical protein